MHQNLPFFMKKRPTMAIFWSRVGIFGLFLFLRALDAKKQIVGTHRSRKHNLQHPYAPKYAIFYEYRPKMAFLCQLLIFLPLYKQLKDPPSYFEGAECKKASCGHTEIRTTHFVASVCTTICHFSWKKTAKNGHFLVKKTFLLASDKRLKTPPVFEGAGCEKANCRDTQTTQTQFTASVRTKYCRFSRKKTATNGPFLVTY